MYCWGANWNGQLGDGTTTYASVARKVLPFAPAVAIDAGESHTCALSAAGAVHCWGGNYHGELGRQSAPAMLPQPEQEASLPSRAMKLTSTRFGACVLGEDRKVYCWGHGGFGSLGDGSFINRALPGPVFGLSDILDVAAGAFQTCALRADRRVFCWGGNESGQGGESGRQNLAAPVQVLAIP